ncbi:type VII secretion protein EccB [Actinoplanes sp. NPDC049265]|uniref:type VII secretion protein EccB n=1 Tax=Actinoplanes sp. NPDC049265 TaxID=3363902 RepID=UPI00371E58EE
MATRRDLLQAHRFLGRRVHSALVVHETDPEQPPLRRAAVAAWGSVALAVVALVAVGAYGFFVPGGNNAWRDGEAVIVVKETGARYVFVDQRLHPVVNYPSALLALGRNVPIRTVSRESLVGVARGPAIGIPDLPDTLPAANRLATGGWSLCSQPATGPTGAAADTSVLLAGADPPGARPVGERALLVEVPASGDEYLIWHGLRHQIRHTDTVAVGLALRAEPVARVGAALVDVLPAGDAIAPVPVRGSGRPSRAVPGRTDLRIGQLLVVDTGGERQHYLAEDDRLRPISPLQADVQLAAPVTVPAYPGDEPVLIPLGVSAAAAAATGGPEPSPGAPPATRPSFAPAGDGPVCVTYDDGSAVPRLRVGGVLPAETVPTRGRTDDGLPLADRVYVPPGRAAVAEVLPSATAPTGTLVLVSDQGRAYPLATRDVLAVLGYAAVHPVRLPAGLVARVPVGAGLDPAHARDPL